MTDQSSANRPATAETHRKTGDETLEAANGQNGSEPVCHSPSSSKGMAGRKSQPTLPEILMSLSPGDNHDVNGFVLENSVVGIALARDRRLLWVNRRLTEMFGLSLESLQGASTRVLYPSDEAFETLGRKAYAEMAKVDGHSDITLRLKRGNGNLFWCRFIGKALNPSCPQAGSIWMLEDITERKEAEEKLRLQTSALEAAANGIVITDRAARMLWVNPAFTRLTGYRAEEAVGQRTSLLKSGKHSREFYEELWNRLLSGNTWQGELINRRKDGSLYQEETSITPVRDQQGEIQNYVAIKQDISQRKKFEQELAQERDLLQSLMDNLPDYIYFKDAGARFTLINAASACCLGLRRPEDAIGKSNADVFPPHTAQLILEDEERLIATGEPMLGVMEEIETATGKRWVSTTKVPLRDAEDRITGLVGISRDITKFKRAEEAMRESEARYRSLFENMMEGFALCRMVFEGEKPVDFVYLEVNSAFEKLTGLKQVVGRKVSDVIPGFQKSNPELMEVYGRVALTGKPERIEAFVAPLKIWFSIAIYSYERGHFTAIFDNITASKEAEEARRAMELQLRQAQKLEAIGQLAAGIAHEINTPTQYVGDNTRFLQDAFKNISHVLRSHNELLAAARQNALTPAMLKDAEKALADSDLEYLYAQIPSAIAETLEGVERVTKIVRAMKEFSHPGGREKTAADLNKAIESTVTVARNEWKYVADLKLEMAGELPFVPCFLSEFNQCVLNLIVNAAHAIGDVINRNLGAKGLITITTRRDGDWVEVRVADTGTGIAENHRAHIFEPFFTTKDIGRGTGQGLALVYTTIVKKHGGTVAFETEVGRGTTFILRLPIHPKIAETKEPSSSGGTNRLQTA